MIPEPAPAPREHPRGRLADRLLGYGLTRDQVKEALGDADEYAAWMAEIVARPDYRWGPQ